jgi:probable HAF family extracellular repeat protein
MKDLGSLVSGGRSFAQAINSAGYIAGEADSAVNNVGYPLHAVLIDPKGNYTDLGTLGTGQLALSLRINSSNEVVGYSTFSASDNGTIHHFAYVNGAMKDLGVLPGGSYGMAYAVNDAGIIVGYTSTGSGNHAFVYEDGTMTDLNSLVAGSGWTLQSAEGINNAGQIVGYGLNPSGQLHAFELTLAASVPEPSGLVLLALGAGATAAWTSFRRPGMR